MICLYERLLRCGAFGLTSDCKLNAIWGFEGNELEFFFNIVSDLRKNCRTRSVFGKNYIDINVIA